MLKLLFHFANDEEETMEFEGWRLERDELREEGGRWLWWGDRGDAVVGDGEV